MKCKKVLAVAGAVTCLTVGGIVSQASSYVQGSMPGFPEMSCTGSLGFANHAMTATTNCNKTPGGYKTTLEGKLKKGSQILEKRTASGKQKATFKDVEATGFHYGRATHKVYYRDKTWAQNTFIGVRI